MPYCMALNQLLMMPLPWGDFYDSIPLLSFPAIPGRAVGPPVAYDPRRLVRNPSAAPRLTTDTSDNGSQHRPPTQHFVDMRPSPPVYLSSGPPKVGPSFIQAVSPFDHIAVSAGAQTVGVIHYGVSNMY